MTDRQTSYELVKQACVRAGLPPDRADLIDWQAIVDPSLSLAENIRLAKEWLREHGFILPNGEEIESMEERYEAELREYAIRQVRRAVEAWPEIRPYLLRAAKAQMSRGPEGYFSPVEIGASEDVIHKIVFKAGLADGGGSVYQLIYPPDAVIEALEEEAPDVEGETTVKPPIVAFEGDPLEGISDPIEHYARLIAPDVVGLMDVKRAMLLSLISEDHGGLRGRLHVLMVGPPGVGKSTLMLWAANRLDAAYVGKKTSEAGLVGAMTPRGFVPGVLPTTNGGVVCVDELEKIPGRDQAGLLEAMEHGRVTVAQFGQRVTLPAQVRVIAGANDVKKILTPLVDRFDFKITIEPPDEEEAVAIVERAIDLYGRASDREDVARLRAYIAKARSHRPEFPEAERERAKRVIKPYVRWVNRTNPEAGPRTYEALFRVALAVAKATVSDLRAEHFVRAATIVSDVPYSVIREMEAKLAS